MADITMPQLGETVTEGTITRWFKQVGDHVAADETLFEVSTDKVDSEVPSSASGYLAEILVAEGGTVEVGATLAVISPSPPGGDGAGEAPEAEAPVTPDDSGGGEGRTPAVEEATADGASETGEPQSGAGRDDADQDDAGQNDADEDDADQDDADRERPSEGQRPGGVAARPSSTRTADGRTTTAPVERAPAKGGAEGSAGAATGKSRSAGGGRLLSPVVRRLVAEHELDPSAIEGTGAGGRITRNDVLAVIEADGGGRTQSRRQSPEPAAPPQSAPSQSVTSQTKPPPVDVDRGDEVIPFSNIRRRTAEHMVRSKATSAHTLVVMEVDYDGVDRIRLAEKERFKVAEGVNLTYLPFVSRAVVDAIREFPHVNASVGDNQLVVHRDVHLAIAVDLNFEGLMAPVIHRADSKRMRALAREIADLAARARSRKLGPDDIAGGTFTITNPGPFGTLLTGAIINQPQVAILSTDGVRKRPVAVELPDGSDAIAVHPVGNLAITFDHRAVDGAYASAFVARVKDILETRDWAAELA